MAIEKKSDKRRKEEEKMLVQVGEEKKSEGKGEDQKMDGVKDVNGGRVHSRGEREREK